MFGEHIIQQSTMLRGQGHYLEAMACIEKNIGDISNTLHATAWREAHYAAEALGDRELSAYYAARADHVTGEAQASHPIIEAAAWVKSA